MAFDTLKEAVYRANFDLVSAGLVDLTWGNASGADRDAGVFAIKPSGVPYDQLSSGDMVVLSIKTGEVVDGTLRPSSDTPTHRHLYLHFSQVGGVVHTHSHHAVVFAQAEREIPCLGTTHADHFYGPIPVTRRMHAEEIRVDYEMHTGAVIVERFEQGGIDPDLVPAVLVAGHGPFAWGPKPGVAVENAIVLENVARMALDTFALNPEAQPIDRALLDKHFLRKHGGGAYYGQQGG